MNRTFNIITRKPAIWKRLFRQITSIVQPLAPLPPTSHFDIRRISALDIENVVVRAVSLDDNWRSRDTRPLFQQDVFAATHKTLEMKLLPGGHFLVTSMQTLNKRFGLMIWAMEHPATGKPAPIVERYTGVRPYFIQAKYMSINGKRGICVAFLRKRHKLKDTDGHP